MWWFEPHPPSRSPLDGGRAKPRARSLPPLQGEGWGGDGVHRLIRPLLAAAVLWAGAACAELPTYTVVAKDGRLTPATLAVPAGVRFKIVIKNDGREPIEFESLQLRKEKVLAPGAQSFVVIAPLKPGEYDYFDEFHPDTSKGRIVAK